MSSDRVSYVWVKPNPDSRDEHTALVNREQERQELKFMLQDYLDNNERGAHILVSGDRGIGKSILTRSVVRAFGEAHEKVLSLELEGRSSAYAQVLSAFAQGLAEALLARLEPKAPLRQWAEELLLVAHNSRISRAESEGIARQYAAEGQIEASALFGKLGSTFKFSQTRRHDNTVSHVQEIDDAIRHQCIVTTLQHLAESPWWLVVFFDDLDQMTDTDGESVERLLKQLLVLQPCLSVVHLRSEALSDNIRREFHGKIEVGPLPQDELLQMLKLRLDRSPPAVQRPFAVKGAWDPFRQLAKVTGNPFSFLRWSAALLRQHRRLPLPAGWSAPEVLRDTVANAAIITLSHGRLVDRLVRKWDEMDDLQDDRWAAATALTSGREAITETELDDARRLGLLIAQDRFNPDPLLRLDPVLELLRPSVYQQLSEG